MKKIPLWKNVILIGATLVILVIATFAWFYTNPSGGAENLKVKVGEASYLQVTDPDADGWTNDMEWMAEGLGKTLTEVSGNGTAFYVPDYEWSYDDKGEWTQSVTLSTIDQLDEREDKGQFYYEKELRFRADAATDVYLTPESFVASEGDARIDAAVRIAFYEITESEDGPVETLRFIWAPNSNIRYLGGSFVDITASEGDDSGVEAYYSYQKSARYGDLTKIATNGQLCGYSQKFLWTYGEQREGSEYVGQCFPENAPSVFTWGEPDEDGIYYRTIKVKVWLEGTDSECVKEIIGQRFAISLQFTIAPEENDNE